MTHNEIQERLEAYHDRQLVEADQRQVEAHLNGCASCKEAVDRLALVARTVFRPISPPRSTDFFVTRVMARVSDGQRARTAGFLQGFWQWTALALTALAAFLIMNTSGAGAAAGSRLPSTGNVLLAGSGASFASAEPSSEPMDSLLDLPEEI